MRVRYETARNFAYLRDLGRKSECRRWGCRCTREVALTGGARRVDSAIENGFPGQSRGHTAFGDFIRNAPRWSGATRYPGTCCSVRSDDEKTSNHDTSAVSKQQIGNGLVQISAGMVAILLHSCKQRHDSRELQSV